MAFFIIVIICYFVIAFLRKTKLPNELLPILSGCLGLLLSVAALYLVPSIVPETSIITVCIYGFFSGLAATGSNQVFKQMLKYIKNKYCPEMSLPMQNTNEEE